MNTQYNDPKGAAGAIKVPLGLIPPHAMEQTAWVHKLGADKYGPWNWRETGVCASTYVNAILRHLNAWRDGEDLDPESGISHLAHVACSANILMDAEYCDKLQDDRNKRPINDETEEGSPKVAASYEEDWGALDEEENEYRTLEKGDTVEEGDEHRFINSWYPAPKEVIGAPVSGMVEWRRKITGYRILKEGEVVQDGDEVYLSEGHWCPVYVASWATPSIVCRGTYRRKLITNCDLKDKVANCDPKETCDSKKEPQEECKCGRRYVYHWLYGWICEDCDLKLSDYYP